MEIYGTIHFKLILPHFPGFQQEPLPAPVCSHSPDCKDCPYPAGSTPAPYSACRLRRLGLRKARGSRV